MSSFIKIKITFLSLVFTCLSIFTQSQSVGDTFPMWQEGYLDIHAINTGKGECTFFILPDGTTILVDAGAVLTPPPRSIARPDGTRTPGEWISRYILHMLQPLPEKKLDYIIISHFHWDHMGGISKELKMSESGNYILSGITEVGENVIFDKVIDRNWPDYNWPEPLIDEKIMNYRKFLRWNVENKNVVVEQFNPGRNDQIILMNNPDLYPDFEVRNIAANGYVWTGIGSKARNNFPELKDIGGKDYPLENNLSIVFRLSYGDFDYFTGGDISFRGAEYGNLVNQWKNIENPVALVTGPIDVLKANHHANYDSNSSFFLSILRPRVIVIQSWLANQPAFSTWRRMISKDIYPGPCDIFCTNMHEANKIVMGAEIDMMKSQQGHIVIRVKPGGKSYLIYILDDSDESFTIKAVHGPYKSQ